MLGKGLIALLLLLLNVQVWAAIRTVENDRPRSYGYTIGDQFEHEVRITTNDPWRLDPDSLPRDDNIGIGFERRITRFDESRVSNGTLYRLIIRYQLFNAPTNATEVLIPAIELSLVNGDKQIPVFVREWVATVSPLTHTDTHESTDYLNLQPPLPPVPRGNVEFYVLLAVGVAGLLFALLILFYLFGSLPGVRCTQGPFALALKRIRTLSTHDKGQADSYRQALRCLHQAFDETAGHVVTGNELERFFTEHPGISGLREPMEQLFALSRREFFEPAVVDAERDLSALLKLCRFCTDVERGLR